MNQSPNDALHMRFDFDEDHCDYDLDALLARLSTKQVKRLHTMFGTDSAHPFASWYSAAPVRRAVETLRAESHETLADIVADGLHHGSCDCAVWAYETFSTWVQSELDTIQMTNPEGLWVLKKHGFVHKVVGEFDYEDLKSETLGTGYSTWERASYDLDPRTGTGLVRYGSMRLEVVAVTDPNISALVAHTEGSGFDLTEGEVPSLEEILELDAATATLFGALLRCDPVVTEATTPGEQVWDKTFTELPYADALAAMRPLTGLPAHAQRAAVSLLETWEGTVAELAEALTAAIVPAAR